MTTPPDADTTVVRKVKLMRVAFVLIGIFVVGGLILLVAPVSDFEERLVAAGTAQVGTLIGGLLGWAGSREKLLISDAGVTTTHIFGPDRTLAWSDIRRIDPVTIHAGQARIEIVVFLADLSDGTSLDDELTRLQQQLKIPRERMLQVAANGSNGLMFDRKEIGEAAWARIETHAREHGVAMPDLDEASESNAEATSG